MSHVYFDASLELRFPTASPPRRKGDQLLHVYFCNIDLHGSTMTVMVPVPSCGTRALYAHGTRAQVIGPADLIGNTIIMKAPTVTVIPTDHLSPRDPFVLIKATISRSEYTVFAATIPGGAPWPPPADVRCFYDPENEHLHGLERLPELTEVVVSGNLLGFQDGTLDIDVHDISFDPAVPPCNANSFAHIEILSPDQLRAICEWLAVYYPYTDRVFPDSAPAGATVVAQAGITAIVPAVVATGIHAEAADDISITPVFPVRAIAGSAAAGADAVPAAVQPVAGVGAPPVVSTVGPAVQAGAGLASIDVPSGLGCTVEEEMAIRLALKEAFAFRDEGPIGQTPVHWDYINFGYSASYDSEPFSDEDDSPDSNAQASASAPAFPTQGDIRKSSFAVGYEGGEMVGLTGNLGDDEALFAVRAGFGVVSCAS